MGTMWGPLGSVGIQWDQRELPDLCYMDTYMCELVEFEYLKIYNM